MSSKDQLQVPELEAAIEKARNILEQMDAALAPIRDRIGPQLSSLRAQLTSLGDPQALEEIRIAWLGRERGYLTDLLGGLGKLPPEQRRALGQAVNPLKNALAQELELRKAAFDAASPATTERVDFSLPGRRPPRGHAHPITQIANEIADIFGELGYQIATGPDIETDYYNFDALNTAADHPARDSHDTFYVAPGTVLRTHTTPVQIRVMEKVKPPVAIIMPGRVYRVDYDATHSPMFFQMDGVLVDEGVTFADLKGTLYHFLHRMFGKDIHIRFRPHFFPFTEPSAEVDLLWTSRDPNTGETRTKWMEVLGCGMVHPGILKRVGYDAEKYSGFAFGLGLDRIAMARHSIPNIHYMFENDLRFLEQF
jgi:phenylalanyl-tRNA synthetase alpha chain